jgi:hypothetical protein
MSKPLLLLGDKGSATILTNSMHLTRISHFSKASHTSMEQGFSSAVHIIIQLLLWNLKVHYLDHKTHHW